MDPNDQFIISTIISSISTITSSAECCCSALTVIMVVVGILVAYWQLKAFQKDRKAQFLVDLSRKWRDQELYQAVNYVHQLRREWKSYPVSQWNDLAKKWVEEHAEKDPGSDDQSEKMLGEQWAMRRAVSQFLTNLGLLLRSGYLTSDDVFGFVPEVGRLLVVLIPIEIAIQRYWEHHEPNPVAGWDRPFGKLWFNELWDRYQTWYAKRKSAHDPKPIAWSKVSSATRK